MNKVFLNIKDIPKDVVYEKMVFDKNFEITYDSKPYKFKKDTEYFIENDLALFLKYSKKHNPFYKMKINKEVENKKIEEKVENKKVETKKK